MSNLDRPPLPSKPKSSGMSVAAAGCFGMAFVIGFAALGMAALGGGTAIGLILFVVVAVSAIAAHYVLWGWWLGPLIRRQAEQQATSDESFEKRE